MSTKREWLPAALVALAAAMSSSGPVASQGTVYEYTAVVDGRALKQGTVAAGGINWSCAGSRCTVKGPWPAPGVGSCAALAQQVGRLVSYGRPGLQLDASQMGECNGKAPKPGGLTLPHAEGRVPLTRDEEGNTRGERDDDRDGHLHMSQGGDDCDDRDPTRYPGNTEVADAAGKDEDCDPLTFGFADHDGDGHHSDTAFNRPPGGRGDSSRGTDCDDGKSTVHPGQAEVCNHRDDNCNGEVDEEVQVRAWRDTDHDLFGDPRTETLTCPMQIGPGMVTNDFDCDDRDARKNPYFDNCR